MSQIHTQWSHFLRLVITVDFYDIPLERMVSWSYNHFHVHHWVCYRGSAEMSQIYPIFVYILHLYYVMLWGLNRAERLPCFRFTFLSVSHVYLETKIQSWYSCFWTLFAVRADFVSFAHWLMATRKEGMSMTLSMPIQWRRHGAMLMIRQIVSDSPFVTRLLYFSATNFIKANSRGYQLAKSSETELRRPLCSSAPDYVKTFFSSRQRDLFGPIRKISW